jgi:CSLREA domain-containing protein
LSGRSASTAGKAKPRSRATSRLCRKPGRSRRLWAEPLEPRCLLDSGGAAGLLSGGNLTYGSGPLIQNVQIEPIFLKDSATGKSTSAVERSALDTFFTNITSTSYIPSLLGQYSTGGQTIGLGSKGANDIDVPITRDTSFKSAKNGNTYTALSDNNIRNIISNEITHGKTAPVSANTLYFVFTPPDTPVVHVPGSPTGNSVDGDGGYSSYFSLAGTTVYYAVVFDPNPPNFSLSDLGFGSLASQQLTATASHELANALTDPLRDLSVNHGTGWYDRSLNQQVADLAQAQIYTQDANVVQYQWSQQSLGPAHAPGTAGNNNNLFINQLTPPAVDTFAGGPVATFTSTNPNLTAGSFTAYVSFNGFEGLQPATVSGGNNGVYVVSAAPSASLSDGQYGVPFPNDDYLQNGGMQVYVFDQADGGAAQNAPLSARYAPYTVSVAASLNYNADQGGLAHNFRLVKNGGTGNFELYDNSNLVFTQRIAQTFDIEIGADPGVDSSLTLDFSGGSFGVPITFDGGTGGGQHVLTVQNGTFAQESYSASGPDSGTFALDGQAVTVSHVTGANIPTTLAITSPLQTVLAGQNSAPITIQLQDPFGNALPAGIGGVTVQLSTTSNGGSFLNTSGQPLNGNSIIIAQGAATASFKYKDTQPGTPTLTATATSNQPVSLSPADYTLNIASFIVTTSADEDNGSPDPAQGTGTSLREAINAANATAGLDFLAFNIPGSGVRTISPATALPTITNPLVIDGYTQPGAKRNTNAIDNFDASKRGLNGTLLIQLSAAAGLPAGTSGLKITGSGSTIRGLVINGFSASGILIVGGDHATVSGNYIGTDPTGMTAVPNANWGVEISGGGNNNTVGTDGDGVDDAAERNLLSGNGFAGAAIHNAGSDHNVIAGNFIGVNSAGTAALGNANRGVGIYNGAKNNRVGTNADDVDDGAERNIISGNMWEGVGIYDTGTMLNLVAGNWIGRDVTGINAIPNLLGGVTLFNGPSQNTIGGLSAAAGNVIAFNTGDGVSVVNTGTVNNSILSNSIYGNSALGIDLGASGLTPNDLTPTPDADSGPNNLQNFPVISYLTRSGGKLKVSYTVPSAAANSTYPLRVQFFETYVDGQEGAVYLGDDLYAAADAGATRTAVFTTLSPTGVGDKIVATATDNSGNTSEFSATVTIVSPWQNPGPLRWDVNDDTHVAADDVLAIINRINSHGSGLLPDDALNEKPYYDIDGDNNVVAADVLSVINYINAGRQLGGEAESSDSASNGGISATDADDVFILLAADVATQAAKKRR